MSSSTLMRFRHFNIIRATGNAWAAVPFMPKFRHSMTFHAWSHTQIAVLLANFSSVSLVACQAPTCWMELFLMSFAWVIRGKSAKGIPVILLEARPSCPRASGAASTRSKRDGAAGPPLLLRRLLLVTVGEWCFHSLRQSTLWLVTPVVSAAPVCVLLPRSLVMPAVSAAPVCVLLPRGREKMLP